MPRVFINSTKNSEADERRARFNKLTCQPLPLKKRKWEPVNEVCPICLDRHHAETGKVIDTRLVCYGKKQCEHTFHYSCLRPWMKDHEHCPICRDSGGKIGKLEIQNGKNVRHYKVLDKGEIPHMLIIDAFFSKKHANLKINAITFIETKSRVPPVGHHRPLKKYNLHMDVCANGRCKSKKCKHMIVTATEFVEWFHGIPKDLRRGMKLKTVASGLLMNGIRKYAPHIHEHLFELARKDENLRRFNYNVTRAALS
jgi:hypothetical protein